MKKIFCLILLCICMLAVTACDDAANLVFNNMSDIRINYFFGEGKNYYANLSCGYREEIFAYDGQSTSPLECGVLTFGYFESHSYSSIAVELNIDGVKQEYVLQKSPYEDLFMVDIEKIVPNSAKVYINIKNQSEIIELNNQSNNWAINYKKSINIATNHFDSEIENLYFNGKFNAECYLKIIAKVGFDKTYWYFSIIDRSGKKFSILIDVNSGEIIDN